ncbi:ribonuclease H-like domain, reverse transcriptase, RNA-dependent DNA polymerase [Tanacetum coccineum]
METIRLLLTIVANNKWEVHHLDVKSAFLHGDLKKEVYVTQPEGFIKREDNGKVYRLIKALYGLRQAPRAWNIKLDNTLKSLDFKKCALEQAIYTKTSRDSTLIIGVYVDDLIITGTPRKEIDKFKAQMEEKFEISDLGLLAYYLGIEVIQIGGDISIKKTAYANKILKEAEMIDCNETLIPMDPGMRLTKITEGTMVNSTEYRSLIRCLRYLLHTRPDLSYSVRLLSRFMQEPREQHMKAIKQVLPYVKGTKDYGITYKHNGGDKIHGFSDRMESDGHQGRAIGDYAEQKMLNLVLRFHDDGPHHLIDPYIVDDVDRRSFHMFIEIAYKCISLNIKDRPTMDEIVKTIEEALDIQNQQAVSTIAKRRNPAKSLENFRIPLDEIKQATKDFSKETLIRQGDTKVICKGHLSDHFKKSIAAIKIYLPVNKESQFHRNQQAVSTIAKRKNHAESLEKFQILLDEIKKATKNLSEETLIRQEDTIVICKGHLSDRFKKNTAAIKIYLPDNMSRTSHDEQHRLPVQRYCEEICAIVSDIGVAKGLRYLHSGFGEYKGVIHGDFSSKKILLYENLEPKIFGFCNSFLFPENRKIGHVVLKPVVNEYYKDPVYRQTQIRNKESDVYSYGVVLFEILTGMLPGKRMRIGDKEPLNLVSLVRRYYADKRDNFLDPHIRDEIDARSFETFREIAYKCISFNVKDRPSWNEIIKKLEEALYFQDEVSTSCQTLNVLSLSCDSCDSKG